MFGLFNNKKKARIKELSEQEALLLDVRTDSEFANHSIPNSIHIPLQSLKDRMQEIPKDKPIICYCAMGGRSTLAASILRSNGYQVMDAGGIKTVEKNVK